MTAVPAGDDLPKLEKYELLEEIGHGGMATVYRALDARLGREVAVKIIHRHLRDNPEVATRFVAEARAAAKLKHRGIVEVYDVSSEDDREKYLVVELVRGPNLRKVLLDHREMPAEIGAAIAIELCDAIEHAHASGVVHRDIKPENVMVELPDPTAGSPDRPSDPEDPKKSGTRVESSSKKERERKGVEDEPTVAPPTSKTPRSRRPAFAIKITDFGIAKILDAQGVTSTGQVLGSPAHMAPEQIEGGDVDPRTDVFALGVILYECLVGHLPFEGKNPAQVLRRVIEGQYARAETERPTVGSRYSRIIDGALATLPADRIESPAALAAKLRTELEALGFEDPRKEISAFFSDPVAYAEAHRARVVPRLIARGEAARRNKDSSGAACDFNRAHALAPDDLAILRRLTQLGSDGNRKKTLMRVGALVVACGVLGSAAFGAARYAKQQSEVLSPTQAGTVEAADTPRSDPRAHFPKVVEEHLRPTATAVGSAAPSARVSATPRLSAAPHETASSGPEPATNDAPRPVKFSVQPKGATLEVDGTVVEHMRESAHLLKPGAHTAKLTPAPNDPSCDPEPKTMGFTVKPGDADKPDVAQRIGLSLTFRPAKVTVVGPSGGQVLCGSVSLVVGATQEVKMSSPLWALSCTFVAAGKETKKYIELKAGEQNTIAWPAG
jgi:serine/threonine-protein kinase